MAPDEPPQKLEPEAPTRHELVGTPPGSQTAPTRKSKGPSATSTPLEKDIMHSAQAHRIEAGPKPVSRRKVQISEENGPGQVGPPSPQSQAQFSAVDDTVAEVISGFMPRMSESMSSVPGEQSTVLASNEPSAVDQEPARSQEITPTPTPRKVSPPGSEVADEELEEEVEEEIEEEVLDAEDTMFEEKKETPLSSARESETSEPAFVESDSEGVMVVQEPPSRVQRRKARTNDTVTIVISQLSLEEDSPPMLDVNVKQLYVEYWFHDLDFIETPDSLPKPKPYRSIAFNFSKSIPVDMEKHYERRRHLASMLLPNHPDKGRLKFTVVSEPPQTESVDESVNCEEVGVAFVNFPQMLRQGKDIIDEEVEIVDVHDESVVIGQLKMTVECVEVLKAIKNEIMIEETY